MDDKFHEECGVVGIFGHPEAANLTYLGLYALQHRGQESAGIVANDGGRLHPEIGMGLVADVFDDKRLAKLSGDMAIGHNRYSTAGVSAFKNAQPCLTQYSGGTIALAHNGNLVNAEIIRKELAAEGAVFQSTNDSEIILHLIAQSKGSTLLDRVVDALSQVQGAYSLVLMTEKEIVAARDPHGFRPLSLGRLDGGYVVASESVVMDLIEAKLEREVAPGEILVFNREGMHSHSPFPKKPPKHCVFEHIYFSRPDSVVFGDNVYTVRRAMGRRLAREHPVEADLVVPVPDSGVLSAMGYSEESGIPYEMGLIRNHYVGRTFIEPTSQIRDFGVKVKLNAVRSVIEGKRIVVVDDSIVRGTTSRKIVKMLKDAGATEVHVRISSPPSMNPCYYGIDTPDKNELIASTHNLEKTRKYLRAETLSYLSAENMMQVFGEKQDNFCLACFDGNYPLQFQSEPVDERQLVLFPED